MQVINWDLVTIKETIILYSSWNISSQNYRQCNQWKIKFIFFFHFLCVCFLIFCSDFNNSWWVFKMLTKKWNLNYNGYSVSQFFLILCIKAIYIKNVFKVFLNFEIFFYVIFTVVLRGGAPSKLKKKFSNILKKNF